MQARIRRDKVKEKRIKRHDLRDLLRVTWPLLAVIVGLLALAAIGLYLLGGARGYVAGESIWSKAQKEASAELDRYASRLGDEYDFARYRATIAIVLADRRARLALDEPKPDVDAAYEAFAQGRNHPSEIPAMIDLYRFFGSYPAFSRAMDVWRAADVHILRMEELANRLHAELGSGSRDNLDRFGDVRSELRALDAKLTLLEHQFATEISAAARELRLMLMSGLALAALALVTWGMVISRNMLRRLTHQAHYDPLTMLPNRHLFEYILGQALLKARREGRVVAVLYLDLDGFKAINDSLGHAAGDEVLVEMGRRLRNALREADAVARLGGDEFAMMIENVPNTDAVRAVGHSVLGVCVPPVLVRRREIFVTASVGVALFPADGQDADTLLMHADTAMYRAKYAAHNQMRFYASEMSDAVNERFGLEGQLRQAVENDEFEVYYQPVVDLRDGTVVSMEALLRWHHPLWGLTLPERFMDVAEQTGLIVPIGAWVMHQACGQARLWNHRSSVPVAVAVNLSARQFRSEDLVEKTRRALASNHIGGSLLHVEITETAVMDNLEASTRQLLELRKMGIKVSLDDFGTGHSSMSYLKHFPLDEVKIDRSFVQDISSHEKDVAIVKAIIALAHSLELRVTGEGTETEEQLAHLRGLGCDCAQGYLLGEPMPADAATLMLDYTVTLVKRPLAIQ